MRDDRDAFEPFARNHRHGDAIGGQLPSLMTTLPNLLPMHKAGKIRILAISSEQPLPALPEVPPFKAESFSELTITEMFAFVARKGTADPVVAALSKAISAAVKSPAVVATLEKLEVEPRVMTPEAPAKHIQADHAKWGQIVKST